MMMRCGVQLRQHVVGELYETERSYVESLQILVEKYMKPLKNLDNRSLIDSNLVNEIFYSIPEILQHHERFLQALQDRISSDWDSSQVIGNVFIEAIIDTYTAFINNWKNARQAIKIATQAKPAFERFLEAMSREHRNKLTLDALLIMPVQRIPRYELLIKELIKHTPEEHPDHDPLIEAQKEIHELALKIDQAEKEMIHQEQLRELESLFDSHVELQHPQRDFIRYDLVTILGPASLTVAKKERVIFLFCDLLIMTSVKKKASRRTNLHSAFTNSYNDISLLEGNKFKLLLRAQLDQVDIRLANDKLHSQEQQSTASFSLQQQQQGKIIQDKKLQLESDLQILHQIESISAKLNLVDRSRICEITDELSNQLRLLMRDLDRCDVHALMHNPNLPSSQATSVTTATEKGTTTTTTASTINSKTSESPSKSSTQTTNAQASSLNPADSNFSLELIIITSSGGPEKDNNLSANSTSGDANSNDQTQTVDPHLAGLQAQPATSSVETLVINFTSTDRRHAFLQAFLDAKHQRQQAANQQKSKIFSSTLTLRLAQPGSTKQRSFSYDPRKRGHLQHQERLESRSISNSHLGQRLPKPACNAGDTSRICSAPSGQHSVPNMMMHQMSAPQSLHSCEAESRCELSCATAEDLSQACHHHHHHQLLHQPASQPASLDTICCHELHVDNQDLVGSAPVRDNRAAVVCNIANLAGSLKNPDANNNKSDLDAKQLQLVDKLERSLLVKSAPRFFTSLPVNFLATQHPALQFTCFAAHQDNQSNLTRSLPYGAYQEDDKKHTAPAGRDESARLWLCLSNGYVSHVVLIALKRNVIKTGHEPLACFIDASNHCELGYEIIPIIQSAGDVCKAHINCAVQVGNLYRAPRAGKRETKQLMSSQKELAFAEVFIEPVDLTTTRAPCIEVAIKSASPPMDVLQTRANPLTSLSRNHLSESAPAHYDQIKEHGELTVAARSSLSASRLELPLSTCKCNTTLAKLELGHGLNEDRRVAHNANCHRHYHHSQDESRRLGGVASLTTGAQQGGNIIQRRIRERSLDGAGSLHQIHTHHHQSFSYQHINQGHRAYAGLRHNTVPINELRHALERQNRVRDQGALKIRHLAPPSNTPDSMSGSPGSHRQLNSLDLASHNLKHTDISVERRVRSATPPAGYTGMKSFKSARLLRHQASLRTSSILAKLVGSKRINSKSKTRSELEDTDIEMDKSKMGPSKHGTRSDEAISNDKPMSHANSLSIERCLLGARESTVVSPLSSVSSLNSTNSSLTVNSICTSSPNRSCHDLLPEASSIYASDTKFISNPCCSSLVGGESAGIRERSATMPSQAIGNLSMVKEDLSRICLDPRSKSSCGHYENKYKVSEIQEANPLNSHDSSSQDEASDKEQRGSSVWFGCDDGSIILIDCLADSKGSTCQLCDSNSKSLICNNRHSEIKLSASISDIRNYNETRIFVALTNGQLAIFSRIEINCDIDSEQDIGWSLTDPRILSVANNELNFISKLCMIDETYLWYSYGRSIFVLNTKTLTSEATIKVPTNDVSLQMTMQSIMIDNMLLVQSLRGVWVSFRNSPTVQLYDVNTYKMLIEINLYDPINKMLSFGNEILRQHKTACLKATTLVSFDDKKANCTTLFIGTSAGIILHLDVSQDELAYLISQDNSCKDWKPQVGALRNGHSGHVRFLDLISMKRDSGLSGEEADLHVEQTTEVDWFLISGGTGLDIYGPQDSQQSFCRLNVEEDNLNHMLLWKL